MSRFIDWFHTPGRDIAGGIALLVLLFAVITVISMVPDMIRLVRIKRM
jgi:hypothetical protein